MTWVLFLAAFALGFGACGLFVWFAQSRNLPGPGQHTGPMLLADEKPSHPRFGELIETPAEGIEAVRPDGVIRVGAHERNVQRRQTPDRQPWDTASLPAIDPEAELRAMRREYIASRLRERERAGGEITTGFMRETVNLAWERPAATLREDLRNLPGFGEKPVATVLAAQAEAEAAA